MYQYIKRFIDIVLSLGAIVFLSPVLIVLAVLIKLDSKGPVLFRQKRVGKGKIHFEILKFRTMYADVPKDVPTHLLADPASKITKIGRFLRKSSLDELPQIFNILKGEMSLVGPRPLPTYETEGCNAYQLQRLLVKPGLTCYWQVSGRNDISFDEWIEMDLRYIREASIWTDIKILFMTVGAVFSGKGAY